jgi:spermidine synthase
LQVVQAGPARLLVVDWGIFSAYDPETFRTGEYYDYLLLAPLLRPGDIPPGCTGCCGEPGTVAKQITEVYGPVPIDGVEIDPAIVALGREYFDMNEPNLRIHTTDGRAFLAGASEPYDWVIIDAYQGSDSPSHLVTVEFFEQLKRHLSPHGVLALNLAWWTPTDTALLQRLAAGVGAAFPRVYAITGISSSSGAVLLAGSEEASLEALCVRAARVGHAGLVEIAAEVSREHAPRLRPWSARPPSPMTAG